MMSPIAILVRPSRSLLACFGAVVLYALVLLGGSAMLDEDTEVSPVELVP